MYSIFTNLVMIRPGCSITHLSTALATLASRHRFSLVPDRSLTEYPPLTALFRGLNSVDRARSMVANGSRFDIRFDFDFKFVRCANHQTIGKSMFSCSFLCD